MRLALLLACVSVRAALPSWKHHGKPFHLGPSLPDHERMECKAHLSNNKNDKSRDTLVFGNDGTLGENVQAKCNACAGKGAGYFSKGCFFCFRGLEEVGVARVSCVSDKKKCFDGGSKGVDGLGRGAVMHNDKNYCDNIVRQVNEVNERAENWDAGPPSTDSRFTHACRNLRIRCSATPVFLQRESRSRSTALRVSSARRA